MRYAVVRKAASRLLSIGLIAVLAPAVKAQDYPILVNSPSQLRDGGLAVSWSSQVEPLANRCYYYGDGSYLISTSDEFYRRFKSRGFSLQAMCLGLISQTRYDPETGRRLPTYILVDAKLLKGGNVNGPGAVSDEMPLDLPDCFKNANPYSDCQFRFGRISGKPLTTDVTDVYRALGATIAEAMQQKIRSIGGKEVFLGGDASLIKGFRSPNGYSIISEASVKLSSDAEKVSAASVWVSLATLPYGYGYALDADGGAGPDVNPAALKAAKDGQSKPQIDPRKLRDLLLHGH